MDSPLGIDELRLTLRLELRLSRIQPQAGWTAELRVPGSSGHLMFPSLPALCAYIARLENPVNPLRSSP